ncbi:hypothetical protein LTR62_001750 [Meristemomyces frigidus]|uniref:Uncharacterized protein n=1 Tax=Meristemomyces frigidus TaxID=1508187 RepID=A0AAN7YHV3_9PEZI|nr:hypothetical protein LTR62_001750 [Meristemomyces frigidus]
MATQAIMPPTPRLPPSAGPTEVGLPLWFPPLPPSLTAPPTKPQPTNFWKLCHKVAGEIDANGSSSSACAMVLARHLREKPITLRLKRVGLDGSRPVGISKAVRPSPSASASKKKATSPTPSPSSSVEKMGRMGRTVKLPRRFQE